MNTLLKAFLLASLFCVANISNAQQTIPLGRTQDRLDLVEDQVQRLRLHIDYAKLQSVRLEKAQGVFSELSLDGGLFDGQVGDPKLPVTQRLIEIPFGADVEVKVLGCYEQEFDLADYGIEKLIPVQAPVSKNDVLEDAPFVMNENTYALNEFIGQPLAHVEVLGMLRGYRIAKLTLSPVTYNPQQGKIRVCNGIDVEISFISTNADLTSEIKAKTRSPYFDFIKERFLNQAVSRDYPGYPDMTRYPVKYVIVADRMFEGYIEDFVRWKTQKGFQVILAYTDEIGATPSAIQSYLHGLYNSATVDDPAPSFILFVGDTQQIPAYIGTSSQKVTDVYYASVDGDYFPEMYYGRFSARTVEELIPQVEKTLYYERYQFVDPSYLDRVNLIAGWDDYWNEQIAQPTIRYGMDNWFNEAHGYSDVYPYYGPDDYDGCYQDDKVSVGMINYTAHCSETVWGTPSLSVSSIYNMHNEGFYPLSIGNCCESSQFGYGECIGEAWVRAEKKGAVCYLGSAPSTYWYEDAWWAMGAYHITDANMGQTPQYNQTTMGSYDAMHEGGYISTGGLVYCGNLAVTEACNQGWSEAAHYYWEAYNVLGDPSLVCYHAEGTVNTVSHDPVMFRGFDHFSLEAEEGSFVGLSKDGMLLGNGMVDESGALTLDITPVTEGGFVELVVTKPQRIPYICYIPVAVLGQPYLVVDEATPETFAYNQDTPISVTVRNVGDNEVPANTLMELLSQDDRIEVLSSQCHTNEAIPVGGTAVINDAFMIKATPEVNNKERFRLVTVADCGDQVNSDFYVNITKPVFEYVNFDWDQGFVSGGAFDLWVTFRNVGDAAAVAPMGRITSSNPGLQFAMSTVPLCRLEPREETTCRFTVLVSETVPEDETLEFEVTLVDAGVVESHVVSVVNRCDMELELHDAGGNGWEGAAVRVYFEDGTFPTKYSLEEGSSAIYQLVSRKGYKIGLMWISGSNDTECSFILRYADGELIYESGSDLHGTLLQTTLDCTIHQTELSEVVTAAPIQVFPNPASGQVNVIAESPIQRCVLMNCVGQVVIDKRQNDSEIQLNVSEFTPGVYLLRVCTSAGETVQKIMIK
jgi:hypothetical protein